MSGNGTQNARRRCQATTTAGLPCPTYVRRHPDLDGLYRCIQHSVEPAVQEAIRLARHRGGFKSVEVIHGGPVVVSTERYLTAESLDVVFDEAINALRLELRAPRCAPTSSGSLRTRD